LYTVIIPSIIFPSNRPGKFFRAGFIAGPKSKTPKDNLDPAQSSSQSVVSIAKYDPATGDYCLTMKIFSDPDSKRSARFPI